MWWLGSDETSLYINFQLERGLSPVTNFCWCCCCCSITRRGGINCWVYSDIGNMVNQTHGGCPWMPPHTNATLTRMWLMRAWKLQLSLEKIVTRCCSYHQGFSHMRGHLTQPWGGLGMASVWCWKYADLIYSIAVAVNSWTEFLCSTMTWKKFEFYLEFYVFTDLMFAFLDILLNFAAWLEVDPWTFSTFISSSNSLIKSFLVSWSSFNLNSSSTFLNLRVSNSFVTPGFCSFSRS